MKHCCAQSNQPPFPQTPLFEVLLYSTLAYFVLYYCTVQ
jgi:hypothetical protein